MQRKLILITQALVMLLFSGAIGVAAAERPNSPDATFTDVSANNTFYQYVEHIADADITHGYTHAAD